MAFTVAAAAITAGAAIYGASQSSKSSAAASQAQLQAAQLQTLVARELHDHWKAYYQQCDIAYTQEVCAIPEYVPQYEQVSARSRLEVLRSFGRARQQLVRCQDVFCVGTFVQNCNFLSGIEAIALADAVNFGYRREENLKIQLDQMRRENIFRQLGIGRNLLSQSTSASNIAAGIGAQIGAQAGRAANGWLEFAGFLTSPEGRRLGNQAGRALSEFFNPLAPRIEAASGNPELGLAQQDVPSAAAVGGTGGNVAQDAGPQAISSSSPNAGLQDYGGDWTAL